MLTKSPCIKCKNQDKNIVIDFCDAHTLFHWPHEMVQRVFKIDERLKYFVI